MPRLHEYRGYEIWLSSSNGKAGNRGKPKTRTIQIREKVNAGLLIKKQIRFDPLKDGQYGAVEKAINYIKKHLCP